MWNIPVNFLAKFHTSESANLVSKILRFNSTSFFAVYRVEQGTKYLDYSIFKSYSEAWLRHTFKILQNLKSIPLVHEQTTANLKIVLRMWQYFISYRYAVPAHLSKWSASMNHQMLGRIGA